MKITKTYLLPVLVAIAMFSACSKDEDTEKPMIVAATMDDEYVAAGDEIHLDLEITDNEGLKEYKIAIHDDFDGHSHGKTATYEKFETVIINAISGLSYTEHLHVDVPANATAGPYHLGVYALDQDGNQSNQTTLTFYITNAGMAAITVSSLNATSENHVDAGTQLTLQGSIAAGDSDIEEITVVIAGSHEGHGKTAHDDLFEWDQDFSTPVSSWDFTELGAIDIPATATGYYELEVKAKDVNGNIAVKHFELHID